MPESGARKGIENSNSPEQAESVLRQQQGQRQEYVTATVVLPVWV